MKFISKKDIIEHMKNKPKHQFASPSELRRKNTIYAGLSNDEINNCKKEAYSKVSEPLELKAPKVVESDTTKDRSTVTISSPTPLNPKQIEELVGADNINVFVDRVWIKSQKDDIWTYSILTVNKVSNFYSTQELKEKLKELLPDLKAFKPVFNKNLKNFTNIYISDDHVGMVLKNSPSGSSWEESDYRKRLLKTLDYLEPVQTINLFSCGDQLNGWNEQTTRGGHIVSSLSNKEQFDIYVNSRKEYYDKLFTSGLANEYNILEVNCSNHSGLGFSYMANELLKLYVETRFPNVNFINSNEFITHFEMDNHLFLVTHGKDDKLQSRNFPLNLDKATESYFTSYMLQNNIDINDYNVHVVKGDLHRFNINECNTFRYLNIPSIANPSDWVEVNFGYSRPGAVVEHFDSDANPTTKLIKY